MDEVSQRRVGGGKPGSEAQATYSSTRALEEGGELSKSDAGVNDWNSVWMDSRKPETFLHLSPTLTDKRQMDFCF